MRSNVSRLLCVSAVLLPTLTFAGCNSATFKEQARSLPPVSAIIQPAAPKPRVAAGEDLGAIAARYRDWGAENAARIAASTRNYEAVRTQFAGEQP